MKKILYILGSIIFAITFFATINATHSAKALGSLSDCGDDNKASFNNAGELNCGDEEYRYDPVATGLAGVPVFVENNGRYIAIREVNGAVEAIIADCPSGDGADDPCFTSRHDPFGGGGTNSREIGLENFDNARDDFMGTDGTGADGAGPFCSLVLTTNCWPWAGNKYDNYSGPGGCDSPGVDGESPCRYTGSAPPRIAALLESLDAAAEREVAADECDTRIQNPLSFILCPIRDALVAAFGNTIDYLTQLLENPNLSSNNNLPNAVRGMVTLANSFYILIFLFIIFANFVAIPGLDNYTIKKTLPKLIAAIILTQFSLLICQVVLDLGNILAVTLPSQLLNAFGISGTPGQAFADVVIPNTEGNIFQNLGEFAIMLIVLLVGLIVGLIAFFYLIARYLFIILLVLSLPLAFAAWVLPNTEQYFKKWWEYFIKLSIMFLLISLLFAGGAIFVKLLTSNQLFGTGVSGFLAQLIALCVPLVVLLLVPKTLKVSGAIMAKTKEAASKGYGGAKESFAGKKISKSAQEGKLAEVKGGFGETKGQLYGHIPGLKKRGARIEAKGAGLKAKGGEQLDNDVGKLDLDRQLALRSSKNKDVSGAAKRAVNKKRRELANTQVIDASQHGQQMLLKHNGDVLKAQAELRSHLASEGMLDANEAVLGGDGKVTGLSDVSAAQTFRNPLFIGGGKNIGNTPAPAATATTPSPATATPIPTPTPAPTPLPTPAPTPTSSSSPSSRWRAATPRPSSAGGPRVIPGSGGAVDLSDLGSEAGESSTPGEPPTTPPSTE